MADTLSQALLEASLLASLPEEDEGSIVIDVDRRTMVLPTGFFFGVYNDKDVLKVPFVIPRYYNELDLSEFQITVNYINSAGYGNIYRVTDAEVTDSAIRFKWVTGRGVFVKEGTVRFIVCLRQIGSNGEVEKEFNTTIASANVLHGLEVDENPDPVAYSILAHMEELKDQAEAAVDVVEGAADRIDDAVTEAEQSIAAMYHSPYIAPTAADMLSHDKVYVYTGNETGYAFGNWYYWNGSAFVSGGVYNATAFNTDDTLSISGAAADAKKTGDEIAELKEDLSGIDQEFSKLSEVIFQQSFASSDWSVGWAAFSDGKLTLDENGTRSWMNDFLDEDTQCISFDTNLYRICLFTYNKVGTYQGNAGWISTTPYTNFNFENYKYRLIVRKQPDNQSITTEDAISAVSIQIPSYDGTISDVAESLARVTKTGTNIEIPDAIHAKVLSCSGNSSVTVAGYNLCNYKTLSGIGLATGYFGNTIPAGKYTVTAKVTTNNPNINRVLVYLGGFYGTMNVSNARVSCTFTITREVDAYLSAYANTQSSPLTEYQVTLDDIAISTGSDAKAYEPHFDAKTYSANDLSNVVLTEYTNIVTSASEFTISYVKKNDYVISIRSSLESNGGYYVQPEDFGAVGDGFSDDTLAVNACIAYGIANGKPIRGYQKYKTTSPVNIIGDNVDLYIYSITYTGTDYAVCYEGWDSNIQMHEIISNGTGLYIKADDSNTYYNSFTVNQIDAQHDGVKIYANKNNLQNRLYFNRIRGNGEYSCVHFVKDENTQTGYMNEWELHGGLLERALWGVRGFLAATDHLFVHTELLGSNDGRGGAIFSENGQIPIIYYCRVGEIVTNHTFLKINGYIQKQMLPLMPGFRAPLEAIDITEVEAAGEGEAFSDNYQLKTNLVVQKVFQSNIVLTTNLIFWGNRFQFPQSIYRVLSVTEDLDMTDQYYNDIIPQKFISDNVSARIDLHPTYAANCLCSFDVEQKNGGDLDIYDYVGNKIFDGSEHGDGKFRLTAYLNGLVPLKYDMSNQTWDIETIG